MDNLNYGIIGNGQTAALVSDKGSIDWACLPEFDSSSVFAKLLDENIGGSFEIIISPTYNIKQEYIKDTAILKTSFSDGLNSFELLDFMPRYKNENNRYYYPADIIRYFKLISGKPTFKIKYQPKLEYARYETFIKIHEKYLKSNTKEGDYDSLYLYSDFNLHDIKNAIELTLDKDHFVLISYNQKLLTQTAERQYLKLKRTEVYWLNWVNKVPGFKLYSEQINRSAITLKLLSYHKTGAVIAAATTSLPETIGEERNWDYRFCWIRDASMVIKVMSELNHKNTVKRFIEFIIDIIPDKDEKIQIMYGINRQKKLTEETLEHLSGYKNSSPVRIGNDAYRQRQNDIYGILMDVIWQQFSLYNITVDNSETLWTITRSIVRTVETNWQEPDKGIWEIRNEEKHFTFSKLLCWVAIDRAIKIANTIQMTNYAEKWQKFADIIKDEILKNAWSEKKQAFTQYYGSEDLDASTLLMQSYGFIEANDPRYISTVKQTQKELSKDGLMYRYINEDDFGLPSSSFTICSFWLINSLNSIGDTKEAKELFDKLLSYSNHLGLFSEDIDFKTKRLLGNFPQAYSHLALIETAINISKGNVTKDDIILEAIHRNY